MIKSIREFLRKINKPAFWLAVMILLQSLVYVGAGASKAYIHMDEAYSLALAQYDKIDITDNADFYNTWHTSEYFQDYLAVQEKDHGDWRAVYENQKNDVHPPLYYVLLRGVMEVDTVLFSGGKFSKWAGMILNIVIMVGCTVVMYFVVRELLGEKKEGKRQVFVFGLILMAGLTVAGISTAVYIRMYGLLTLMVLLTLWVNLKIWRMIRKRKQLAWGWCVALGVLAVLGTLTQYYYLFFLVGTAIVMTVKLVRERDWGNLGRYLGSLVVAGILVLMIWPHALQHMFFGYRGQGVLKNLLNLGILARQLWDYLLVVDYNVFHHLLIALVMLMAGLLVYRRIKGMRRVKLKGEFWMIFWPTVSYFGLAALVSPFIELRYIMPICGLIFVLVGYVIYELLSGVVVEKWREGIILAGMAVVIVVAPIQIGFGWMRVELLYRDRQMVMTEVTEKSDAPILYFITTENNRFLDNILPFAVAKDSYLALDLLVPTKGEVEEILHGKDLRRGLFVFVSSSQDQELALGVVKEVTGLKEATLVQGINTCDVYYLH